MDSVAISSPLERVDLRSAEADVVKVRGISPRGIDRRVTVVSALRVVQVN